MKHDAAARVFGLRLVEEFSASWGVTHAASGKTVWASLRARPLSAHLAGPGQPNEAQAKQPTAWHETPRPVERLPAVPPPVLATRHDPAVSLELTNAITTIGRTNDNDFVLDHPSVSRNHALICRTRDGFMLVDLGSVNGVCVDGRRLRAHQSAQLTDAAPLRVGDVELTFTQPATPSGSRTTIASAIRSRFGARLGF
jgi:pSer/pThr/pTyr-binding forkhead associated (FHA) protein